MKIVITDNAILAGRDFPGARIVVRLADVVALPDRAAVAVVEYRVGTRHDSAVTAAETLIARGFLKRLLAPEKPLK